MSYLIVSGNRVVLADTLEPITEVVRFVEKSQAGQPATLVVVIERNVDSSSCGRRISIMDGLPYVGGNLLARVFNCTREVKVVNGSMVERLVITSMPHAQNEAVFSAEPPQNNANGVPIDIADISEVPEFIEPAQTDRWDVF